MMVDPFESLDVEPKSFTVSNAGGSRGRWANRFKFSYSRRDNTWQLVRAEENSYDFPDPDNTSEQKTHTPPKHYGKIDIADFDPLDYLGRGKK